MKISGVQHLTYWQQLKYLSLNSLERRPERHIIMYVCRILERHAPNFDLPGNCGISSHWHLRRGRYCLVPRISHQAPLTVQTIRYGSFAVRGPMLFNTLPTELRNMTNCSSESFKQALDTFLKTIPDEHQTYGYTYMRRAESNSLIHMTPLTTARHPSISEELDNMPQARGHGHLGTEPGNHRQRNDNERKKYWLAMWQDLFQCLSNSADNHYYYSYI